MPHVLLQAGQSCTHNGASACPTTSAIWYTSCLSTSREVSKINHAVCYGGSINSDMQMGPWRLNFVSIAIMHKSSVMARFMAAVCRSVMIFVNFMGIVYFLLLSECNFNVSMSQASLARFTSMIMSTKNNRSLCFLCYICFHVYLRQMCGTLLSSLWPMILSTVSSMRSRSMTVSKLYNTLIQVNTLVVATFPPNIFLFTFPCASVEWDCNHATKSGKMLPRYKSKSTPWGNVIHRQHMVEDL